MRRPKVERHTSSVTIVRFSSWVRGVIIKETPHMYAWFAESYEKPGLASCGNETSLKQAEASVLDVLKEWAA